MFFNRQKKLQNDIARFRSTGLSLAQSAAFANQQKSSGFLVPAGILLIGALLMSGGAWLTWQQPAQTPVAAVAPDRVQPPQAPAEAPALPTSQNMAATTSPTEGITAPDGDVPAFVIALQEDLRRRQEAAPESVAPALTATADTADQAVRITATDCVDVLQRLSETTVIYFEAGQAAIPTSNLSSGALDRIGTVASTCDAAKIEIAGHSDASGDDGVNLQLSWQRADNVLAELERMGFSAERFEPLGYGSRQPFAQGAASDDPENRRVEFRVTRTAKPQEQ